MKLRKNFLILVFSAAFILLLSLQFPVQAAVNTDSRQTDHSSATQTFDAASSDDALSSPGSTPLYAGSKKSISKASVSIKKGKYYYTGKAIKPSPTVKINSKKLKKGKDYKVSYKNNTKCGTATITITGINKYSGTVKKTFKIAKRSLEKAWCSGLYGLSYTGHYLRHPSLTVYLKIGEKTVTLKKDKDYTLSYSNNRNVTTYSNPARVTITGKGGYKGSITRTFSIYKGYPGLWFKNREVTHTNVGTFTHTPKKSTSESLSLTYTSSNPKVVSVNKKTGKITPKKLGTATITVTSASNDHFYSQSASYKVKIRAIKWKGLRYKFHNYSVSRIPLSTFKMFFSAVQAKNMYDRYYDVGNGGCCFGFCGSVILLKMSGTGVKPKNFRSSADKPYNLKKSDTFKKTSISLHEFIEAMQATQLCYGWSRISYQNQNDLDALVKAISTGKPVLISMHPRYGGGHAILGYRFKKVDSNKYYIYCYDSNYPDKARCIVLTKKNGKYATWKYKVWGSTVWSSGSGGSISFMTASDFKKLWKDRSAARKMSQMIVSSDQFEILDENGAVIASLNDNEFTTTDERICFCRPVDTEFDSHLIYLPGQAYTVVNSGNTSEPLDVTIMNENRSVTVNTGADRVFLNVNDFDAKSQTTFNAGKGENFEVTLMTNKKGGNIEELSFTGTGEGEEVTLGTEGNSCVINSRSAITLSLNGEEVDYTLEDGKAVIEG